MSSILTVCSTKNLNPEVTQLLREQNIDIIVSGRTEITYCIDRSTLNRMHNLQGAIVCTSQHAVKSLSLQKINFKFVTGIFCLSGSTLTAARELRIPVLGIADCAEALALTILEKGIHSITWLCSESHRPELHHLLQEQGVQVNIVLVYSTIYHQQKINEPFDSILFFSPNSVKAFLQQNTLPEHVTCFCIGQTTASFLRLHTNLKIIVSPFPSQEHMANQVILLAQSNRINYAAV